MTAPIGAGIVFWGIAFASARVQAGVCAPPQPEIIPSGSQVPTNTRVLVLFPGPEATIYKTPLRVTATAAKVRFDAITVALRDAKGQVVPAVIAPLTSTTLPSVELRPQARLAPLTKYAVVIRANNRDFVVSEFTTGSGPVEELPKLAAVERARYYAKYPCVAVQCRPFADIRLRSDTAGLFYEVHLLDKNGELQKDSLRTIVRAFPRPAEPVQSIHIGGGANGCWPQPDFQFPTSGKLQLGLRAVDLAGNQGPLLRTEIDLDHPLSTLD